MQTTGRPKGRSVAVFGGEGVDDEKAAILLSGLHVYGMDDSGATPFAARLISESQKEVW